MKKGLSRLKLPPNAEFDEELRLFIWRPRGVINEQKVNQLIRFIVDKEATSDRPFNRLSESGQLSVKACTVL